MMMRQRNKDRKGKEKTKGKDKPGKTMNKQPYV
jgi:hypothetical protein